MMTQAAVSLPTPPASPQHVSVQPLSELLDKLGMEMSMQEVAKQSASHLQSSSMISKEQRRMIPGIACCIALLSAKSKDGISLSQILSISHISTSEFIRFSVHTLPEAMSQLPQSLSNLLLRLAQKHVFTKGFFHYAQEHFQSLFDIHQTNVWVHPQFQLIWLLFLCCKHYHLGALPDKHAALGLLAVCIYFVYTNTQTIEKQDSSPWPGIASLCKAFQISQNDFQVLYGALIAFLQSINSPFSAFPMSKFPHAHPYAESQLQWVNKEFDSTNLHLRLGQLNEAYRMVLKREGFFDESECLYPKSDIQVWTPQPSRPTISHVSPMTRKLSSNSVPATPLLGMRENVMFMRRQCQEMATFLETQTLCTFLRQSLETQHSKPLDDLVQNLDEIITKWIHSFDFEHDQAARCQLASVYVYRVIVFHFSVSRPEILEKL